MRSPQPQVLDTTQPDFWRQVLNLFDTAEGNFVVLHEGALWSWSSFPGDSLCLQREPDHRGLRPEHTLWAPQWVCDEVFA